MRPNTESIEKLSSRFLSVEEAAKLMKVSKGTLHNWLSQGRHVKRKKLGGRTYVDSQEIEAWLKKSLEEC